jgi:hypothetical protein
VVSHLPYHVTPRVIPTAGQAGIGSSSVSPCRLHALSSGGPSTPGQYVVRTHAACVLCPRSAPRCRRWRWRPRACWRPGRAASARPCGTSPAARRAFPSASTPQAARALALAPPVADLRPGLPGLQPRSRPSKTNRSIAVRQPSSSHAQPREHPPSILYPPAPAAASRGAAHARTSEHRCSPQRRSPGARRPDRRTAGALPQVAGRSPGRRPESSRRLADSQVVQPPAADSPLSNRWPRGDRSPGHGSTQGVHRAAVSLWPWAKQQFVIWSLIWTFDLIIYLVVTSCLVCDEWMNNNMLCYIERDMFVDIQD